jgi:Pyridoxamine 5'-phosphate oxidase
VPETNSPAGCRQPLSATERTRHRRFRHLGRADRDCLYAVLDAGLAAHLGVITSGWPMVVPTVYGFTADTLYVHGSVASQSLNTAGTPVCVTITDPAEKLAGLRCITEASDVVAAGGPKVASLAGQAGGGVQSARRRAVMLTPD